MYKNNDILKRSIKKPNLNLEISSDFDVSETRSSLVKYEEYILKELHKKQKKETK